MHAFWSDQTDRLFVGDNGPEGWVAIPATELGSRRYELPPPGVRLQVAGSDVRDDWLREAGYEVVRVEPTPVSGLIRPRLWQPNEFLASVLPELEPGKAIDLGCGSGRDTVALASMGWEVYAVDHLPDAIQMASRLALRYLPQAAPPPVWCTSRIEKTFPLVPMQLAISFFALDLDHLRRIASPGMHLLIETFSQRERERTGSPSNPARVLDPETLDQALPGFRLHRVERGERQGRETVRVWAQAGT